MLCHFSSTMTKDHYLLISYGTKWPLSVDVPVNTYAFIALRASMKNSHMTGASYGFSQGLILLAYAASCSYGGYLVKQGEMNFTDVFK